MFSIYIVFWFKLLIACTYVRKQLLAANPKDSNFLYLTHDWFAYALFTLNSRFSLSRGGLSVFTATAMTNVPVSLHGSDVS